MKNLIIVSQYFPPEIGGGSQRSFGFASELSRPDLNVTVVTPFPSYLMHKDEVKIKFKLYEKSVENNLTIYRTFVLATDRGGFLRRIAYYLSFTFSAILTLLLKIKNIDYIFIISPPLFTGITGVLTKKFKSAKLIFDIGDLWPESAIQLGFLKNSFAVKLAQKLECWIYKHSDIVNVVTKSTYQELKEQHPDIKNLAYVPNFVETSFVRRINKNEELLEKYNLRNKIVFGYAGNIGSAQGVKIIIDAAKQTSGYDEIKYLIIGEGIDKQDLEREIKSNELSNVLLLPPFSKDEIVKYISLFDVMIIPLVKNDLFKITIPSKLYESMSSEIPVLLCVDGEAREIVENANCGLYVEPENSVMLAEKVLTLYNDRNLITELGKNGRSVAVENFDRKKIILNFCSVHLNGVVK